MEKKHKKVNDNSAEDIDKLKILLHKKVINFREYDKKLKEIGLNGSGLPTEKKRQRNRLIIYIVLFIFLCISVLAIQMIFDYKYKQAVTEKNAEISTSKYVKDMKVFDIHQEKEYREISKKASYIIDLSNKPEKFAENRKSIEEYKKYFDDKAKKVTNCENIRQYRYARTLEFMCIKASSICEYMLAHDDDNKTGIMKSIGVNKDRYNDISAIHNRNRIELLKECGYTEKLIRDKMKFALNDGNLGVKHE